MTTMELIERGIGHNCLSDAYDLGRADAIEEFKDLGKLYSEIRADAIEEFAGVIMCEIDNVGVQKTVLRVMEQLKEKQDEN